MKKINLMCAIIIAISFSHLGASDNEIFEGESVKKTEKSLIEEGEYANFGFYQRYVKKFQETEKDTEKKVYLNTAIFYMIKGAQEQISLLISKINSKNSHKIEEAKKLISENLAQFTQGLFTPEEIEGYLNYKK